MAVPYFFCNKKPYDSKLGKETEEKMFLKHENCRHVTRLKLTSASVKYYTFYLDNPIWLQSHKNQSLFTRHGPTLHNNPQHLTKSDNLWPEARSVPVFSW